MSSHSGNKDKAVEYGWTGDLYTDNQPDSWFSFDLGARRSLIPNHYCLRHRSPNGNHVMRSWRFEGSNDGSSWITLRTHQDDTTVPAKANAVGAWSIATGAGFRYFRLYQTGKNSNDNDHLMCSNIEIYGLLTDSSDE